MWDADQIRATLAAIAAADPECTAFGASRHGHRLGPPLAETDVTAFEQQHQITLPASYRGFVLRVGDGGAGPYYGLYRLDRSGTLSLEWDERPVPRQLATPFPHTTLWNPNAAGSESWMTDDEYFDAKWSTGSLIIAEFGCGAFFRLVVSGAARGQVWFDDRAADGGLTPGPDFRDWYLSWLESAAVGGR